MNKEEVYEVIDNLRNNLNCTPQDDILIKICNYIESNIDEFLECYENTEEV